MKPSEFRSRVLALDGERHHFSAGLTVVELVEWRARHRGLALPDDLIGFYRMSNGVRFGVDMDPRGSMSLSSLQDLEPARQRMWSGDGGLSPDDIPLPHWLAISDHVDGACFIVLDPDAAAYYLMDACGADLSCPLGNSFDEVLDYIWQDWVSS
ncbi:MAG: SMI1/KNR4 family protein [Planctomycetes bacterium]|nr:SMI1/KNR4 family protein [Planctomycetota bacterium]